MSEQKIQYVNPRKARRVKFQDIQTSLGMVKAKKLDLTAMLFEGLVPLPILSAVQKMLTMSDGMTEAEKILSLTDEQKRDVMNMLRHHAVVSVIEPVVVDADDNNEDHLPVELLTMSDLMEIWNATAIVPMVAPATAARFRSGAAVDDSAPVPDGEDVQPSAEPVASSEQPDSQSVELITG